MYKLSVIVPVYNVENYIHQCIDSLIKQDYIDMEILLIDDGSPDRCPDICDQYAKNDKRIRVIHQPNKGIAETRNVGIREATGQYIAFLDSDDYALPGMFSCMMKCIEADKDVDMVICDYNTFHDDSNDLKVHTQGIEASWKTEKIRDEYLFDHYPNFMWNKIYHKSLFDGLRIPAGIPYEDLLIMAPLVAKAKKIIYIPKAFPCYRLHASSFSLTSKIKKKLGIYLAWREHEKVCLEYNCASPLQYCRMRAQQSAVGLKIIDMASNYLSTNQRNELDCYLKTITDDTSLLSTKHKLELWAINHLPASICLFAGKLSIWCEEYKQNKVKNKG